MRTCYFDFETRSECDIRKAGADAYARHPSTEILCCAFKIDDGPTQIWHPFGELDYTLTEPPIYKELHSPPKATPKDMEFVAHNATFDHQIWEHVAVPKYGFPPLPLEQIRDTMAQGCAMALPGSLAGLGEALRVDQQKYSGGSKLIRKMSIPPYEFSPVLFAEMMDYCGIDVDTMAEIDTHLLPLQPKERKMWELNYRINQRGIGVDFNLIEAVSRLNVEADLELEDMLAPLDLTPAKVRSQAQFKAWALEHGVEIPSLNKKELGAMTIEDPVVLQGLELREQVCKSSIKKFDAMDGMACSDGRIRGNHVYHRATTGRFAGSGVQVQNMPRPVVDDTDALADAILCDGDAHGYDAPVKDVLASLVRSCLVGDFTCADFSSIESRVLFWLADCQKGLDVYRSGDDLYCVTASSIFGKAINKKDHPFERSIGKIAVLACIAEGELVLTDHGEVPIEDVTLDMLVWDGIDFVKHEGIIDRGIKEVITYDGLTATEDHIVFTEDGREIPFGVCAEQQIRIAQTGLGGQAVWVGDCHIARDNMDWWAGQEGPPEQTEASARPVRGVQNGETDIYEALAVRQDEGMPALQPSEDSTKVARSKIDIRKAALRESKRQELQELRGPGHRVPFQVRYGCWSLADGEHDSYSWERTRSHRQRRPLREGELKVGIKKRAVSEQTRLKATDGLGVQTSGVAIREEHRRETITDWLDQRRHIESSRGSYNRKEEGVAKNKRKSRVFDILNCGPQNRFTVANKLVHNCGFQGATKAFKGMCDGFGLEVDENQQRDAVQGYRDAYPEVVKFWYDCEEAAIRAIEREQSVQPVGRIAYKYDGRSLKCKLPSGRVIHWWEPAIVDGKFNRKTIEYSGVNIARKWTRKTTYAGDLAQSATQAVARDLLCEAMMRLDDAGWPIVLHVHDEILADGKGEGDFLEIMTQAPEWADGLPITGDLWTGRRFRK